MRKFFKIGLIFAVLIMNFVQINVYASVDKSPTAKDQTTAKKLYPNRKCLKCHADDDDDAKIWEYDDGSKKYIYVDPDKFEHSVHGKRYCVECHTNVKIKRHEHQEKLPIIVSCIECHTREWKKQQSSPTPEYKHLDIVMKNIDSYMKSIHARPSLADQSRTNAACYDCHEPHQVAALGSIQRKEHRLKIPEICGRCHPREKKAYLTSIHGKEVVQNKNSKAAVCSDCHTTHNIDSPKKDKTKLLITKNCGNCHEQQLKTYRASYHGQVNKLGFTNTAKCYDCHGNHAIKKVDDPTSKVFAANRIKTCQQCHKNAPEGFLSFQPHGNPHDFEHYPALWITAKFMDALIIGVFVFFWTHVTLWFYREYKDRKAGKGYFPPPCDEDTVYFRRFSTTWRILHLLFAVSTMTLVLTGSSLLFSQTHWAKIVVEILGGPQIEGIVHRTAAIIWLSVFFIHIGIAAYNIFVVQRKTFRWFGPTSMLPNWQDLRDIRAMFGWFFGRRERPAFEHWTYWQKFDYWAPFWGAAVIGFSGLMLFFPTKTAMILPGYVFNIATIVHADEALLATIFLFTVHFFNEHFRPDKFPLNISIFTGAVPLEEFKHDHKLEYERLKANGQLEKYLVKKPSKGMERGSELLGALLIFFGLTLLTLAIIGVTTMGH